MVSMKLAGRRKHCIAVLFAVMLVVVSMNDGRTVTAAPNDFWLTGQNKMNPDKENMRVYYEGDYVYISGHMVKAKKAYANKALKKYSKRKYKVSSRCKIVYDNGNVNFQEGKKFWKAKENLSGYIEVHIKNNKVIYISYGA